jgi:predicted transcriptional regulator
MGTTRRKPGRKPLDPGGSSTAVLRIESDLLGRIDRLAAKHGRDRSNEIRAALRFWTALYRKDGVHVGELTILIGMLVEDIEKHTDKKWIEDPLTGTAVRELVGDLIFHLAPTPSEPLTVPQEIKDVLTFLKMRYENQEFDFRNDDRSQVLAILMRDIGSGFRRNRKVWMKRTGAKS